MKEKLFLITTLLFTCVLSLNAQDLIIKQNGDSINCKITKFENNNVYYSIPSENESKSYAIQVGDVISYAFNYYHDSTTQVEVQASNQIRKNAVPKDYIWFHAGVNAGRGFRTEDVVHTTSFDMGDYYEKLKNGLYIGGDIGYFFNKYLGCGAKLSVFSTNNSFNNIEYKVIEYDSVKPPKVHSYVGSITNNILITYVGLYASGRYNLKNSDIFLNLGVGNVFYSDNNYYLHSLRKFKGSAFTFSADLGYNYYISENLSVVAKFSYHAGVVKSIYKDNEIQDLDESMHISVKNYAISIGLRYYLK